MPLPESKRSTFVKIFLITWYLKVIAADHPRADPPGFRSVDCGCSEEYEDAVTGLTWVPDTEFIRSGVVVDNIPVYTSHGLLVAETELQLKSLRRFPDFQSKHCYTFNVTNQDVYLVRATFYYSSSEEAGLGPLNAKFGLSIDSTIVVNYVFTSNHADERWDDEFIIRGGGSSMYICLIPREGVPFINAIELRPMSKSMYLDKFDGTNPKFLRKEWRINCGVPSTSRTVRYPEDKYDRHWLPPDKDLDIFANYSVSGSPDKDWYHGDWNNPPNLVMSTAWDFRNLSSAEWKVEFPDWSVGGEGFLVMYVGNVDNKDNQNKRRDFSSYLKGKLITTITDLEENSYEIWATTTITNLVVFSLNKTAESALGPILNGAEAFIVREAKTTSTDVQDVSAISLLKEQFPELKMWAGDPCLPVAYDWIICSEKIPPRITSLMLNDRGLLKGGGPIPQVISQLTALEVLRLDGNNLSGEIPDLSRLSNLRTLHLENNNLSGVVPVSLVEIPSLRELYLQNNGEICVPKDLPARLVVTPIATCDFNTTGVEPSAESQQKSSETGLIVGVCVGVAIFFLVDVACIFWCVRKKRAEKARQRTINALGLKPPSSISRSRSGTVNNSSGLSISGSVPIADTRNPKANSFQLPGGRRTLEFSFVEIKVMSNNFARQIGEGGYGPVYRGKLPNGHDVAVKMNADTSEQGTTEFVNEVELLSRVHHNNIVPLIGYCAEGPHQILVYEYMSKGTLRQHLHREANHTNTQQVIGTFSGVFRSLDWNTRLQIVQNAARGLDYLHTDANPRIIHRDVKSSNILLDEDFTAKVGDFGISKLAAGERSYGLTTGIKGSTGYLDPEYFTTQRLTSKSDVYSFGVVLFEVISGKQPGGFQNLVEWARKNIRDGNLKAIVDPVLLDNIEFNTDAESVWRVAEVAMACTECRGLLRLNMGEVLHELTEILRLSIPSTTYDSNSGVLVPISQQAMERTKSLTVHEDELPIATGVHFT